MTRKMAIQCFVVVVILLGSFMNTSNVQAGSGCGSTYVVQRGDYLGLIARRCGVPLSALYAANPGVGSLIYPGQVLAIPGGGYYTNTYTVQYGDTFAKIAARFGVSTYALWAANPQITNINLIYVGQVINVPNIQPVSTKPATPLFYGLQPPAVPHGTIQLINSANSDVYVSLQCTRTDGDTSILEYPVKGKMKISAPTGSYIYVAWVGGKKFEGSFRLAEAGDDLSITFYQGKVVVQ